MAGLGDVLAAFDKFQLDVLDNQWVEDIVGSEFSNSPEELPEDYYEIFPTINMTDIIQVIENATYILNKWLENNACDTSQDVSMTDSMIGPNWGHLREINQNALLALIYFYVSKGQTEVHNIQLVHTCIKASNLYFVLLLIPKANVYKVFQCSLYEKCLETFDLCKHLNNLLGKQNEKKTKTKRVDGDYSDEEFPEDTVLSISQEKNIVKQLNFLLSTFQQFVKVFSFKGQSDSLKTTLKVLAQLTRTEKSKTVDEFFNARDQNSLAPLSRNAFLTLRDLCSNQHGKVSEIIRLVLYNLFPSFTLIGGSSLPEMNSFTNKELNNIRNIAVSFLTKYILTLGEVSHFAVKVLIQQLCANMIDRADYRSKATDMIIVIMSKLSVGLYYELVKWIIREAVRDGAYHRVIGLDLLAKLIYLKPGTVDKSTMSHDNVTANSVNESAQQSDLSVERQDSSVNGSQERIISFAHVPNHVPLEYRKKMLAVIIDRIRDEATTVKTKALAVLSDLISDKSSPTVRRMIDQIFVTPYLEYRSIDDCGNKEKDFVPWKKFHLFLDKMNEPDDSLVPGGKNIVNKVFGKCLDERISVRKTALQLIANLFKLNNQWMTSNYLELYGRHCRDPALSVRKEMAGSLTELVLYFPTHEELISLWVKEVLPQIIDREIRVQEQVMQHFYQLLIENITSYTDTRQDRHFLPWKLLFNIGNKKMKSFLVTTCGMLKRSGMVKQQLINNCRTHVGTENNSAVWLLLSAISEYYDIEQPGFVFDYFVACSQNEEDRATSLLVLRVLHNCWHKMNRQQQERLRDYLLETLSTFSTHNTLVSLCVDITAAVMVHLSADELTGKQHVTNVAADMIQVCEGLLEKWLDPANVEITEDEKFMRTVCLLGFLTPICPQKVKESTFNLLFNFVFPSMNKKGGGCYMGKLKMGMKSIAVVTLGKLALCNGNYARTLVPALSHLLTTSRNPVELNNVVVAIADIGERYANLIEPLIPALCLRLKSEPKSVANTTLLLLVELLQEEFLKPKGRLVYHLLTFVNEPDPTTVNLVKYYFINILIPREHKKLTTMFMLGLFHYNCYFDHPNYPRLEMTEEEETEFNISGRGDQEKRMTIYKFMLANIPPTSKVNCVHYLIDEVLKDVAEGNMPLSNNSVEQLVHDTLSILLTREAQVTSDELTSNNKKNDDNENEEDGAGSGGAGGNHEDRVAVFQNLGRYYYNAIEKKNIVEHVVPICCKLKRKLSAERPNLVPLLRKYVRFILQTLKADLAEVFKDDEQFGKEMIHELEVGVEGEDREDEGEEVEGRRGVRGEADDPATVCLASQLQDIGVRKSPANLCKRVSVVIDRLSHAEITGETAESVSEWGQQQQPPPQGRIESLVNVPGIQDVRQAPANRLSRDEITGETAEPVSECGQQQRQRDSLIEEYDPNVHDQKRKTSEYRRSSSSDASRQSDDVRLVCVEAMVEVPPVSGDECMPPPTAVTVVKKKKSVGNLINPETPSGTCKQSYYSSSTPVNVNDTSLLYSEFSPIPEGNGEDDDAN